MKAIFCLYVFEKHYNKKNKLGQFSCHLYVEPLKNDTHELIYKTETDSQTSKTNLWLPKGTGGWGAGGRWIGGLGLAYAHDCI